MHAAPRCGWNETPVARLVFRAPQAGPTSVSRAQDPLDASPSAGRASPRPGCSAVPVRHDGWMFRLPLLLVLPLPTTLVLSRQLSCGPPYSVTCPIAHAAHRLRSSLWEAGRVQLILKGLELNVCSWSQPPCIIVSIWGLESSVRLSFLLPSP